MERFNTTQIKKTSSNEESAIYKYLGEEIDYILSDDVNNYNHPYIPNPTIESQLSPLLNYCKVPRYYLFSGLTGSGKSTIMHHVICGKNHKTTVPFIRYKTLIIPFDFDLIIVNETNEHDDKKQTFEQLFINQLSSSIILLREKYGISESDIDDYAAYVRDNSMGLISYIRNGKQKSSMEIHDELYETQTLVAMLYELCLSLNNQNCKVNNVLFVLDNVESVGLYGKNPFTFPLLVAQKSLNIMINKSIKKANKPKWVPNILICCRHYVYRIMHTRDCEDGSISQVFESFMQPKKIDLSNPVTLKQIVNERWEVAFEKGKNNNQKWKDSMRTISNLLNKVIDGCDLNGNNLILDFNLMDVRSSLSTLKRVIYNKRWLQKDIIEQNGSFNITSVENFNFKQPYIIRALGMGENDSYFSTENIIPNLLINTQDYNVNIFVLLALKYFLKEPSSWDNAINIDSFYNTVDDIFSGKFLREFEFAMWVLLDGRMLLRSSDQSQSDVSSITKENYKCIKNVFISQAAKDYWNLLGENSIIFEMLIDDIYINNELTISLLKGERRNNRRLFNKIPFEACLDYLEEIAKAEKKLVIDIFNQKKDDLFYECFGRESIALHMLRGLVKSFDFFFREERIEEMLYKRKCMNKIERIKEIIQTFNGQ